MKKVDIYTDGGCSPNPGKGGWAVVVKPRNKGLGISEESEVLELSGAEEDTSNNRMELTAAIKALEWLEENDAQGAIHTDSQYVKNGITQWIANWKKNGWRTANKKPVKNKDLWERLDELVLRVEVEWAWVRGHVGNRWNERADELVWRARGELS